MSFKNSILSMIVALVLGASICYFAMSQTAKEKSAWIDIKKLYSEFDYKKEIEKKVKSIEGERQRIMDSLELDLKIFIKKAESVKPDPEKINEFEAKRQEYLMKKDQFEKDNITMEENYNAQILNQLNQYVKDYCKENKLEFVFGADGNGNLMYAPESKDITTDVLVYVNNKYKGVK